MRSRWRSLEPAFQYDCLWHIAEDGGSLQFTFRCALVVLNSGIQASPSGYAIFVRFKDYCIWIYDVINDTIRNDYYIL
jgi:hypothetical protein